MKYIKAKYFFYRNFSNYILMISLIIAIFVMIKSSQSPVFHALHGTFFSDYLMQFSHGNDIANAMSSGFIVSVFFIG